MHLIGQTSELALHTRRGNQVRNELNHEAARYGDTVLIQALQREFKRNVPRTIEPSRKYNCHGLSFASRRTAILETQEIHKILMDDDYAEVSLESVLPGDIAVYHTADGDIDHSGVVISVTDLRIPVIVSKWGTLNEVIHQVPHCRYDASNVKYYRIKK